MITNELVEAKADHACFTPPFVYWPFSCTADPPVGGAEITAPEEYLNVNHYVETALHSDFPDFLPDREALDLPPIFSVTIMNIAVACWEIRSSPSLCR